MSEEFSYKLTKELTSKINEVCSLTGISTRGNIIKMLVSKLSPEQIRTIIAASIESIEIEVIKK